MIGVIDYGLGNVAAFLTVYKRLNMDAMAVSEPGQLLQVDSIILPGVGAFDEAMDRLQNSGLMDSLNEAVCEQQKPVLGVCVGMQMMAKSSEEGQLIGLGWVEARVRKFQRGDNQLRLPHMGWNNVSPEHSGKLFKGLNDPQFYFLHSYYLELTEADCIAARSNYGGNFTCAIHKNNIYGTQFHPEKSHEWGITLLRNFAEVGN